MSDRKYDEATARAIFETMVWPLGESCVLREGGIFLNEEFRTHSPKDAVFDWTPAYDMDWPGAPNPMTAPLLPIPFTAKELAACMLDGPGWGIQDALDRRIGFPLDEEDLEGFSLRGRWARDALKEAYSLAEKAQMQVGAFDYGEERQCSELLGQLEDAEDAANTREGVFENGITRDEANLRRARAVASVATLQAQALQMQTVVAEKRAAWRKAMVGQLIGPETQPGPLARRLEAMQSDEHRQAEMEYEAATLRESEAKKALVRREALLSSPETLGGIAGLEAAEAAVEAATREVEDARHAIRIMRGDFLETNPPTAIVESGAMNQLGDERSQVERAAGWWTATMDARTWWSAESVTPLHAAMLLSRWNPNTETSKDAETSSSDEMVPQDFLRLKHVFEGANQNVARPLKAWLEYARQRSLKIHSWIEEWEAWIGLQAGTAERAAPVVAENKSGSIRSTKSRRNTLTRRSQI